MNKLTNYRELHNSELTISSREIVKLMVAWYEKNIIH